MRCDHGANYFKTDDPEVYRLIHERLPNEGLIQIEGDIATFDQLGTVSPGDPAQNAEPKWNYRDGISTLGKRLAAECDADIRYQVRVARLEPGASLRWRLIDSENARIEGEYDHVIFTTPAPQAQAILTQSEGLADEPMRQLIGGLSSARYHRQFAFLLGWERAIDRPEGIYALINTDRRHAVSWLSFENGKPGRVPDGHTVVIAQMSPDWSDDRYDRKPASLVTEVHREVAALLGGGFEEPPTWHNTQRWGFSLPHEKADADRLAIGAESGLHFAGDLLVGKGRVGEALKTGLDLGQALDLS